MLDQDTQASAPKSECVPIEFSFEDHTVRTIPNGQQVLFVAKDVAEILGYGNTRQAILDHCKHAKSLRDLWEGRETRRILAVVPSLHPQLKVIPESDVYRLTMRSELDAAERFQDWVTEDVLPTIRKTGRYETTQGAAAPKINASEKEGAVFFPNPGRYTVTVMPDGKTHVYRNELKSLVTEANEVDFSLLCHTLKNIDASWRRVQHLHSLQIDTTDGFALRILNSTIQLGSETADQFIGTSQYRNWDPT